MTKTRNDNPRQTEPTCSRRLSILFTVLFFLLLLLPAFTMNTESDVISELDNRPLAELPDSLNTTLPRQINQYIDDRIGFRIPMIDVYTNTMANLLGEITVPDYIRGEEDMLFRAFATGETSEEFLDIYTDFLSRLHEYAASQNVTFYYMLNPLKQAVYGDSLPASYPYNPATADYLRQRFDLLNIPYYDAETDLKEAAAEGLQVYNKRYDPIHWNDHGAFIAARGILSELQLLHPDLVVPELSDYRISQEHQQYLAQSRLEINEDVPSYALADPNFENLTADYRPQLDLHPNHGAFMYADTRPGTAPEDGTDLLVFYDSYYISREKFWLGSPNSLAMIHVYQNLINAERYIEMFKPDVIVVTGVEMSINGDYFDEEAMEAKVFE